MQFNDQNLFHMAFAVSLPLLLINAKENDKNMYHFIRTLSPCSFFRMKTRKKNKKKNGENTQPSLCVDNKTKTKIETENRVECLKQKVCDGVRRVRKDLNCNFAFAMKNKSELSDGDERTTITLLTFTRLFSLLSLLATNLLLFFYIQIT